MDLCGFLWLTDFFRDHPEWDSKIHTVVPFSVFCGTSILIFITTVPDYNSISKRGFSFSHPHQHSLSFVLLAIAIRNQVRQNLNAGLICISLMIDKECWITFQIYTDHFSFFFQKLFNSSGHLIVSMGFDVIFWCSLQSQTYSWQWLSSHSVCCLSTVCSVEDTFMQAHLSIIGIISCAIERSPLCQSVC